MDKPRIVLAGRIEDIQILRGVAVRLREKGYEVNAQWLDRNVSLVEKHEEDKLREWARQDIADCATSTLMLVLDNPVHLVRSESERDVMLGLVLGRIPIVVFGYERPNHFTYLYEFRKCERSDVANRMVEEVITRDERLHIGERAIV